MNSISKKFLLIILLLVIVSFGVGLFIYIKLFNKDDNDVISSDIIMFEVETSEYFDDDLININSYVIDSVSELESFYNIYSDKLDLDVSYLDGNHVFVQVSQVGSGSIQKELVDVNFNNNRVNFVVSQTSPEIGTDDMAFWYLVAVIPDSKLNNLNLDDWAIPSVVLNNK